MDIFGKILAVLIIVALIAFIVFQTYNLVRGFVERRKKKKEKKQDITDENKSDVNKNGGV